MGVAVANGRLSEQCDLVFHLNLGSADYGYRLRVDYRDQDKVGGG